jgi:hypothetical protein
MSFDLLMEISETLALNPCKGANADADHEFRRNATHKNNMASGDSDGS